MPVSAQASYTAEKASQRENGDAQLPSMAILSLKFKICGDVYNPVFMPQAVKAPAIIVSVEPFPFVPATVITRLSGNSATPIW